MPVYHGSARLRSILHGADRIVRAYHGTDLVFQDNPHHVTVTVASGTVGSDLTDFPAMVRLSDMPAGFWDHVRSDGGDIRVEAEDGTPLPADLVRFDYAAEDGVLFFLAPSLAAASDTVFAIRYGNPVLTRPASDDPLGMQAVWTDYAVVLIPGEGVVNRATGVSAATSESIDLFEEIATSPDVNGHEGVATDGTNFFLFDSAAIRKYDASWNLLTQNTNVGAGAGNPGITGLGGGTYLDGKLYSASTVSGTQYLAVWDAATLAFIEAFNVSAFASAAADYTYRLDTGLLYTIRFGVGTKLIAIDPSTGAHVSAEDITLASALVGAQGIVYWRGAFWVSNDNPGLVSDQTWRVGLDGSVTVAYDSHGVTNHEGIDAWGDVLYQLDDTGTPELVRTMRPLDVALGAGGGAHFFAAARIVAALESAGALGTVWTLGCTFTTPDNTQRTMMSLSAATGTTNQVQVAVDNGSALGVWDASNSWLYTSPTLDPAHDTAYRVHVIYNGTTARSILVNGGSKGTDATITAKGSTLSRCNLGSGQADSNAGPAWKGHVGFAYARAGVLADAWLAAEYANLNDPSAFAQVGSEETP